MTGSGPPRMPKADRSIQPGGLDHLTHGGHLRKFLCRCGARRVSRAASAGDEEVPRVDPGDLHHQVWTASIAVGGEVIVARITAGLEHRNVLEPTEVAEGVGVVRERETPCGPLAGLETGLEARSESRARSLTGVFSVSSRGPTLA